ncbi:unnamed protein product [Phaedon cochleariae]|uniref:Uncharacterized protein n=1 Tax=Phaedon cochleariae TaxID=80249 RepID=A0A9P0DF38_PHACE|nr:unnamed protein product [Phaedon cochleariae]
MEKIATENLFLLEFLVDNVDIGKKCECDSPPGEKCVSFQFLDNAPLDVCEADFAPKSDLGKDENIKSGKSCLFSLSPDQVNDCLAKFDILVTVHKKMQPGWLPEKVDIGIALISIANLFAELVESVSTSDGTSPTAKTLKDVFDISTPIEGGAPLGKIGVYIRMSCFGKLIVTQFQMNLQDKSVLFKDKEGKSLYRYKKAGKGKEKSDKCNPRQPQSPQQQRQQQPYNSDCPKTPCGSPQMPNQMPNANTNCPLSPCPMDQLRYQNTPPSQNYNQAPCNECGAIPNAPCFSQGDAAMGMNMGMGYPQQMLPPCMECGSMPYPPCLPQAGFNQRPNTPCEECMYLPEPPCAQGQSAEEPEGNYQEIGAAMGGNSLTIRVHKDKNKVEQLDPNAPGGSIASDSNDCSCLPGRPGKKTRPGQALSLGMRPGIQQGNQNLPFSFRMGGRPGQADNNVVVNPPVATAPDGTQFTEFSDPNKEMFVLRIGKKSEGVDKRQNLELELCTPKGPDLKPIPKKETRDTQYDPLDAGPEVGEGKKGGKGKDKGKGKGKGKKK